MKVGETKEKIVEEFEVTPEEVERDIMEHLRQLKEIKAIIED
jgi:predicted small metal-binding protein